MGDRLTRYKPRGWCVVTRPYVLDPAQLAKTLKKRVKEVAKVRVSNPDIAIYWSWGVRCCILELQDVGDDKK